jgi:hypothetical protein
LRNSCYRDCREKEGYRFKGIGLRCIGTCPKASLFCQPLTRIAVIEIFEAELGDACRYDRS